MNNLSVLAQLVVAVSIVIVWVGRFDNIVKEFKQFGYPNILRNAVGAAKISLSTLLVAGIWYPSLVLVPALLMAFLMVCALLTHLKVKNPFVKFIPSLVLLLLCLFIAGVHGGIIP